MQQHKKIFPLFFLLLLLSVLVISFIPQAKATTTYEWIQNNSFEDAGGNLLNDASFESGTYVPWVNLGGLFSTAQYYSGVYSMDLHGAGDGTKQSLGNVSSTLISIFTLWAKQDGSNVQLAVNVWYNDSSYTGGNAISIATSWTQYNLSSYITTGKFISYISIGEYVGSGLHQLWVDNVYLGIYSSGQTDFNATTTPWFTANPSDFQGINVAGIAHMGIACVYDGYTDYWQAIIQNINFLDSNMVTNLTCYVSGSSVPRNVKLKMNVIYSDRSFSTKTVIVTSNNEYDWKFMNFTDVILQNKIIIQLQLVLPEQTDYYVHIDDVSLLASVPTTQSRFSYTLTPLSINQTGFTFTVYQKTNYVFNGFLYDLSGNSIENGTYILITSKGSQSGNIISGVFSFVLTERLGVTDFQESIIIQINNTLTIQLTAIWKFVGEGGEIGEGIGYDSWYSNMVITYMILFIFLIVPPLIIAFEFSKHDVDPFMGFIGGLCLTVPIAYIIHIIDLWVLFVFVLGLVLMILAKLGAFNRF